jgi:hypothetical protein
MDWVTWDIEITEIVPNLREIGAVLDKLAGIEIDFVGRAHLEGAADIVYQSDWKAWRPLGISCAATLTSDGDLKTWATEKTVGLEDGCKEPCGYMLRMTPEDVRAMADYLWDAQQNDFAVVTWNGLQFDFDVLAEECGSVEYEEKCAQMALEHVDPMFQFYCQFGYPVGLDAMAKGLGLSGKTEGMHGDLAPVYWAQGQEKQEFVLEYVSQDVRATAEVYEAIINTKKIHWITSKGLPSKYPWKPIMRGHRLLTCAECLDLAVPDTSWMKPDRRYKELTRQGFYEWTGYEHGATLTQQDWTTGAGSGQDRYGGRAL